jgi:hypothetical protein
LKQLLLAVLPIVLLATAAAALPDRDGSAEATVSPLIAPARQSGGQDATTTTSTTVTQSQTPPAPVTQPVTQPETQPATQQPAAPPAPAPATTEEPTVPPLVVDKTQLVEANALLEQAITQANLAVSATTTAAQQEHIQQAINILAGSSSVYFKAAGAEPMASSSGVGPLLSQALSARQSAEEQWVAALYQRDAQFFVAGPGAASQPSVSLPLGTAGMRPEEQASQIVDKAILQAVNALRLTVLPVEREGGEEQGSAATVVTVSTEAADLMQYVARQLQAAQQVVQIAINR